MIEDDEGFLGRWSRRKRSGGAAPVIEAPAPGPVIEQAPPGEAAGDAVDTGTHGAPGTPGTPAPVEEGGEQPVAGIDEAELPDIESLDRDSDYTAFLRKGVPDHLKRAALHKLWRSDPLFGILDGLNDYDEDFTLQFRAEVVNAVKTSYKVGKGFVDDDEEETVAETADDAEEDAATVGEGEEASAADAGEPAADPADADEVAGDAGSGTGAADEKESSRG
jgi:hypothetical protein